MNCHVEIIYRKQKPLRCAHNLLEMNFAPEFYILPKREVYVTFLSLSLFFPIMFNCIKWQEMYHVTLYINRQLLAFLNLRCNVCVWWFSMGRKVGKTTPISSQRLQPFGLCLFALLDTKNVRKTLNHKRRHSNGGWGTGGWGLGQPETRTRDTPFAISHRIRADLSSSTWSLVDTVTGSCAWQSSKYCTCNSTSTGSAYLVYNTIFTTIVTEADGLFTSGSGQFPGTSQN